jgi:hypothetical protein
MDRRNEQFSGKNKRIFKKCFGGLTPTEAGIFNLFDFSFLLSIYCKDGPMRARLSPASRATAMEVNYTYGLAGTWHGWIVRGTNLHLLQCDSRRGNG